jgi:hypothetical protein
MTPGDSDWRRPFEGAPGIPVTEGDGIEILPIGSRMPGVHVQPPASVAAVTDRHQTTWMAVRRGDLADAIGGAGPECGHEAMLTAPPSCVQSASIRAWPRRPGHVRPGGLLLGSCQRACFSPWTRGPAVVPRPDLAARRGPWPAALRDGALQSIGPSRRWCTAHAADSSVVGPHDRGGLRGRASRRAACRSTSKS